MNLNDLDQDLWQHILQFLEPSALLFLASASRHSRDAIRNTCQNNDFFAQKIGSAKHACIKHVLKTIGEQSDGPPPEHQINRHRSRYMFACTCGSGIGMYAYAKYWIRNMRTRHKDRTYLKCLATECITLTINKHLRHMNTIDYQSDRRSCCNFPLSNLYDGVPLQHPEYKCSVCGQYTRVFAYRIKDIEEDTRVLVACIMCARSRRTDS